MIDNNILFTIIILFLVFCFSFDKFIKIDKNNDKISIIMLILLTLIIYNEKLTFISIIFLCGIYYLKKYNINNIYIQKIKNILNLNQIQNEKKELQHDSPTDEKNNKINEENNKINEENNKDNAKQEKESINNEINTPEIDQNTNEKNQNNDEKNQNKYLTSNEQEELENLIINTSNSNNSDMNDLIEKLSINVDDF